MDNVKKKKNPPLRFLEQVLIDFWNKSEIMAGGQRYAPLCQDRTIKIARYITRQQIKDIQWLIADSNRCDEPQDKGDKQQIALLLECKLWFWLRKKWLSWYRWLDQTRRKDRCEASWNGLQAKGINIKPCWTGPDHLLQAPLAGIHPHWLQLHVSRLYPETKLAQVEPTKTRRSWSSNAWQQTLKMRSVRRPYLTRIKEGAIVKKKKKNIPNLCFQTWSTISWFFATMKMDPHMYLKTCSPALNYYKPEVAQALRFCTQVWV